MTDKATPGRSGSATVRPRAWWRENLLEGWVPVVTMIEGEADLWRRSGYGAFPLYDEETLWNACARAGDVEREKIKAALLALHEQHKHQHNYYLCAVQDLFVARRFSGRVA